MTNFRHRGNGCQLCLLLRSIRPAARAGGYTILFQGFHLRCIWMNGMDILIEYKKKKGKKPAIAAKNDGTMKKNQKNKTMKKCICRRDSYENSLGGSRRALPFVFIPILPIFLFFLLLLGKTLQHLRAEVTDMVTQAVPAACELHEAFLVALL